MGLKVWLPLDGDLKNLGCSSVEVTNNGATVDNNGKIGKCYSFDGTNDYIVGTYTPTTNISFCCWVYFPAILTGKHIFDGRNTAGDSGYQPMYITAASIQIGGSGSGYSTLSYTWAANTWYHICVTHDAQKGSLYVNGNFISSSTTAKGFNAPECNFTLGSRCNQGNYSNVKLNDVRIYDHCLSAAEVHEIAQGLVVHYKLDGGLFGNPNLLAKYVVPGQAAPTSTANGGRTTWLGDYKITIPATENADTYFRLFMTEQLISGTTYTISCKVSGLLDGSYYRFPLFAQSNTGMGLLYIDHNGLCSLTFTMNWTGTQTAATGANGETVYVNFLDDAARSLVSGQGPITLYDFKLEKGDTATTWCPADSELAIDRTIIRDSSGYGHNATLVNTIEASYDTPRYTASTALNGTTTATIEKFFPDNVLIPELTYACWVKRTYTTATGQRDLYRGILRTFLSSYGGIDFRPFITWMHATTSSSSTNSWTTGDTIPINTWVHMAWTFKDGLLKYYQNGVYVAQSDRTGTGQFIKTNFHTGLFGIGTSTAWQGNLSDMRIYTTALLDNDIKLLYNMGSRIDNLGGVHSFELNENDNNLLAGTVITSSYNNKVNPYTKYNSNGEMYFDTNNTSAGSNYISINPTNHTYYYDFDISLNAGNKFYIGFERYDADKTSRSNNATIYICDTRPTEDINHKHIFGTVDLSTDGVNPCAFIALRILNGWSGTTSGVVGTATIHSMSLREVSTIQNPKLYKNGILLTDEFKEYQKASFYKNGFVEATEFLEI